MKTKKFFFVVLFLMVFKIAAIKADTIPTYRLVAKQVLLTANEFEFDIFLKHTNPEVSDFYYYGGQYFLKLNPEFRNGGTLRYTYALGKNNDTLSDLPTYLRPRNPSLNSDSTLLRLAANTIPQHGYLLNDTGVYGLRVIRMSLTNTNSFNGLPGKNIRWQNGIPIPFTRLFAVVGIASLEITDSLNHIIDFVTDFEPVSISNIIPEKFYLSQNYPNPFNPVTNLEFGILEEGFVSLKIYSILGKEVTTIVNGNLIPGTYKYNFDASTLTGGVYFYSLIAGDFSETKKMLLIK